MKKTILLALLVLLSPLMFLNFVPDGSFEGVIDFEKKTGSTTQKYKYIVKADKVRIEDYGTDGTLQGVMLVNTSTGKVYSLSPDRKLYMEMPAKNPSMNMTVDVKKNETTKDIAGYKCKEWVATCTEEQRVVTYYMGGDNFNFFIPLLKTLKRKDKLAVYYLKLTGTEGMFPMMGVEKKSDGTVLSTLKVNSIKKQSVEDSQFEIPKGYKKFEK